MCGILGIAGVRPVPDRALFTAMRDVLAHRGPDDAGEWWDADGRVGLLHRRLAIVDVSPGGHQPMSSPCGDLQLILNGEIYNYLELREELRQRGHRFRSESDTEVLLTAYREWGLECVPRLNGMFAFGLYDARKRQLILARDRAGERPLFYRHADGVVMFASELKALMANPSVPRRLDSYALEFYLAYGYVPGDMCLLQGCRKLLPAHVATYSLETNTLEIQRYWSLPDEPPPDGKADVNELVDELECLFADAVRRQLMADVPVGVLLSGGLDSSLVTAMAARASSRPVKTFTITFPGHATHDEGPYARLVAQHFGTEHLELRAEPASVDLLPTLARQYDEPIADSSIVPTYLVSRLIRPHATVALGGDGGDELFGGYPHYRLVQQAARIKTFVPACVRNLISAAAAHHLPVGYRGRNHLIGLAADLGRSVANVNVYFDPLTRARLLGRSTGRHDTLTAAPECYKASLASRHQSPLRRATETDFRTTMVDAYLVKVDRASMLNSLEVRAPMLDYRVADFAFGRVPARYRATRHENKVLLRLLGERLLPSALDLRRKQGFSMPLKDWFAGEWGLYIEGILTAPEAVLFDRQVVRELFDGQARGYTNTERLFSLTLLELWRREYNINIESVRG